MYRCIVGSTELLHLGHCILNPTTPELKFVELRGDTSMKDGSFDTVRQLRYRVLREPLGMPYESTLFAGDDLDSTVHVVSYRVDSSLHEPIGCLSLLIADAANGTMDDNLGATPLAQSDRVPLQSVQLRGMVVLQSYQGFGSQRRAINSMKRRSSTDIPATSRCEVNDNRECDYNEPNSRIGVGGALLNYVHRMAKLHGWELWCNARESAVSFYAKYGWSVEGELFEIPKIGPHYVMRWNHCMFSEDTK